MKQEAGLWGYIKGSGPRVWIPDLVLRSAADSVDDIGHTRLSLPQLKMRAAITLAIFFSIIFCLCLFSSRERNHLSLTISTMVNSIVTSSAVPSARSAVVDLTK